MTAPTTPKPLAVTKQYEPGGRICRDALSTDGEWGFHRAHHRGTPWITYHLPTHWELRSAAPSLERAASWAAAPTIYHDLLTEALFELTLVDEPIVKPTDDSPGITSHDWARGVLTWLADNHPELLVDQVLVAVITGPMFVRPVTDWT